MKTSDIVAIVAEKTGTTQAEAKKVIDTFFDTVVEVTAAGESVSIHGVGKFTVSNRSARSGVNPKTREPIHVPAKKVLVFRSSPAIKK